VRVPPKRPESLPWVEQTLGHGAQVVAVRKLTGGLTSLVHELTPRLLDAISGTGEMLAAPVLAGAIAVRELKSEAIEATGLIVTNDRFGSAEPLPVETRELARSRLFPLIERGVIPVVTGFIGGTIDGVLTTLGRGGSDYSASIIGAALDADEVWIWTDVDGVMTANPTEARPQRWLTTARRCFITRLFCLRFDSGFRCAFSTALTRRSRERVFQSKGAPRRAGLKQ